MATQRAIIVGTKNLYPVDDGKKAVINGILLYLIDKLGAENVCYSVLGAPSEVEQNLPCTVEWISPPSRMQQIGSLLGESILRQRRSFQEALYYSHETSTALVDLIERWQADLVLMDTLRIGQLLEAQPLNGVRKLLYMDDLFYLRFRSMLNASADKPDANLDPSGTFASNIPAFAQSLIRIEWVKKTLLKLEMRAIEKRELASPAHYDKCFLINPEEARVLQERTSADNIFSIKPIMFNEPCPVERNYNGKPDFIFFGTLRNPAHLFSVCHFLEHCMPALIEAIPDVSLKIVGGGADEKIRQLSDQYPDNVDLLGFVENVDTLMSQSCALLIPLQFGGGLRLKTLTAFYYGLPVITTDFGINGLNLEEGAGFIRENSVCEFTRHMQQLQEPGNNEALSARAIDTFQRLYSKEAIHSEYDELFSMQE